MLGAANLLSDSGPRALSLWLLDSRCLPSSLDFLPPSLAGLWLGSQSPSPYADSSIQHPAAETITEGSPRNCKPPDACSPPFWS